MPVLSFDQNNGCSLPPFNAVTNKLFFFRVNVFDMELPAGSMPDDAKPGKYGKPPWQLRLGVPLTDLFPQLLPDLGPMLLKPGQRNLRVDRDIFVPASKLNRKYSAGAVLKVSATDVEDRSLVVDGQDISLPSDKWDALQAGR